MTHRRSRAGAAALLTVGLSLALCTGAWAQGMAEPPPGEPPPPPSPPGDRPPLPSPPSSSPDPPTSRGPIAPERVGSAPVAATGTDDCPSGQVLNSESGECERDRDCPEFDAQEEAQRFFESRGGPEEDPHRLNADPEEDDTACDNLPRANDGGGSGDDVDDEGNPSGGVDSGYGPVAPVREASSPLPFVGGLGLLLVVGLGAARLRRAG